MTIMSVQLSVRAQWGQDSHRMFGGRPFDPCRRLVGKKAWSGFNCASRHFSRQVEKQRMTVDQVAQALSLLSAGTEQQRAGSTNEFSRRFLKTSNSSSN